jgi:hypothetical protein
MATPPSRYRGARNVISNGPVKTDANAKHAHRAIRLASNRDVYGSDSWSKLYIYFCNMLGVPTGTHIGNPHPKSPNKKGLEVHDASSSIRRRVLRFRFKKQFAIQLAEHKTAPVHVSDCYRELPVEVGHPWIRHHTIRPGATLGAITHESLRGVGKR